jgi:phage terminase Nu1 subunit (DNA packaging protein)
VTRRLLTVPTLEPYVDARGLAEVMGVSRSTVKRWTAAGMPSETWGMARTRRYQPSRCIAWAREREHRPIVKGEQPSPARRMTTAAPHREE